jgi:D-inositol-3-phosphate glycosyltransferase
LESQACGTPVVAAAVGGLTTAVADDVSGVLVDGHDPDQWAKVLADLLRTPAALDRLAAGTRPHAERFSWDRTADDLLVAYRAAANELNGVVAE